MRVITGSARGIQLISPEGMDVRPTAGKVKEALFSAIQFDIEGREVLDLFAGSGQLGIEALSRGAAGAVFVDNSRASAEIVRKNVDKCRFTDKARVTVGDYKAFLKGCAPQSFGLIFMDPPYASAPVQIESALRIIEDGDVLVPGGIVVCESEGADRLPELSGKLSLRKCYNYGRTRIAVYERSVE